MRVRNGHGGAVRVQGKDRQGKDVSVCRVCLKLMELGEGEQTHCSAALQELEC